MNVYVVGAGAIGSYFGALLAKGGADVTFFARARQLDALRTQGLAFEDVDQKFHLDTIHATDEPRNLREADLVLWCTKTYSNRTLGETLGPHLRPETLVITIQNGVDGWETVKGLTSARVYPGNALIAVTRPDYGRVRQTGGPRKLLFGDPLGANEELAEIAANMHQYGINVELSKDIQVDLWNKFVLICAFGGMTAACRASIGKVLSSSVSRSAYERCVHETLSLSAALSISLGADAFDAVMARSCDYLQDERKYQSRSSMLVDLENKRATEIDSINGYVVQQSHRYGLAVPVNETIYSAVKLAESGDG